MIKKIVFVALVLIVSAFNSDVVAQSSTEENVNLTISTETSREQLWEMRNDLAEQGINFKYEPKFDNDRVLIGIKVLVQTNDGFNAEYNVEHFSEGQVVKIIRNYEENASVPFCVGPCE